jgi:propanol-preferring alcohol dehydrogenase
MRSLQVAEFGAPLVWNEGKTPEPAGSEVLLETVACGVCHSDLHIWEGYYDLGAGRRSFVKDRGVNLPLTLGHEVVGRVVAVGPDVRGVTPGDIRLVYPWVGCGSCKACVRGDHHLCDTPRSIGVFRHGGYSDHLLVPHTDYLLEIGEVPPEAACSYACAGLTAFSALRKVLPLGADDTLVLIGAGGLGLMALQIARELTNVRLIIVDVSEAKLDAAKAVADCTTVNAADGSAFKQVREIAGRRGVEAVIDFVGTGDTTNLGFGLLAKGGVLVVVGLFGGELTLPTPAIPLRSVTVRGSYTGSLDELRDLIAIVRGGQLPSLPVTCYPMGDAQTVLERLRTGDIVGRAVLRGDRYPIAESG